MGRATDAENTLLGGLEDHGEDMSKRSYRHYGLHDAP